MKRVCVRVRLSTTTMMIPIERIATEYGPVPCEFPFNGNTWRDAMRENRNHSTPLLCVLAMRRNNYGDIADRLLIFTVDRLVYVARRTKWGEGKNRKKHAEEKPKKKINGCHSSVPILILDPYSSMCYAFLFRLRRTLFASFWYFICAKNVEDSHKNENEKLDTPTQYFSSVAHWRLQ